MDDEMVKLGAQIADESYNKVLKKGNRIILSDIQNYINQGNYLNPHTVLDGFIDRMKMYVEIHNICRHYEKDETVYIHKNSAQILKKRS